MFFDNLADVRSYVHTVYSLPSHKTLKTTKKHINLSFLLVIRLELIRKGYG